MELVVRKRAVAAEGIVSLDLADPIGKDLPKWEPGAHIDLELEGGFVRQYSLCGDPRDSRTWRVAVLLASRSRGGSKYVHDHLRQGTVVRVRGPRNNFALVDSPGYIFIAGGIGITPMMAMIAEVDEAGKDWTLAYLGRRRSTMVFAGKLESSYPHNVIVWSDEEHDGFFDLSSLLETVRAETAIYCCGPEPLLGAVEKLAERWPMGALHVERFATRGTSAVVAEGGPNCFDVVCQRSGITVEVSGGISILEALEDADVPIMSSCLEGVCGTCRATVLEGEADHRDSLLSPAEKAAGAILPCVSRSLTEKLVLDL